MAVGPTGEGSRPRVARLRASDDLKASLEAAVAAIGGFRQVVAPGDTILLKPNFNTADPPPASSDPRFVAAAIELLYDYGARKVILGESSTLYTSTWRTLAKAGMLEAARRAGAEVVVFERWVPRDVDGRYLKRTQLAREVTEAAKIVYVTCLKTHHLADYTLSLKLAVGFVRPLARVGMHLSHLREKVAELNTLFAPDLILTDGRRCFIAGGPAAGVVREPGLIFAARDRVALDVEGVRVIQSYPGNSLAGRDAWRLGQIRRAVELGLGASGPDGYEVVDAAVSGFAARA